MSSDNVNRLRDQAYKAVETLVSVEQERDALATKLAVVKRLCEGEVRVNSAGSIDEYNRGRCSFADELLERFLEEGAPNA